MSLPHLLTFIFQIPHNSTILYVIGCNVSDIGEIRQFNLSAVTKATLVCICVAAQPLSSHPRMLTPLLLLSECSTSSTELLRYRYLILLPFQ